MPLFGSNVLPIFRIPVFMGYYPLKIGAFTYAKTPSYGPYYPNETGRPTHGCPFNHAHNDYCGPKTTSVMILLSYGPHYVIVGSVLAQDRTITVETANGDQFHMMWNYRRGGYDGAIYYGINTVLPSTIDGEEVYLPPETVFSRIYESYKAHQGPLTGLIMDAVTKYWKNQQQDQQDQDCNEGPGLLSSLSGRY